MAAESVDSSYLDKLLQHAQQLFTFAEVLIVKASQTSRNIITPQAIKMSSCGVLPGYIMLPKISHISVKNGEEFADWGRPTWLSWDDKRGGTQVLLLRVKFFASKDSSNAERSGLQKYKDTAEAVMCGLLPDSPTATDGRTDGGLVWVHGWNALQHPVAASFLAVLYSDYMLTSRTPEFSCSGKSYSLTDLQNFAKSQAMPSYNLADHLLGNNPMKMSYFVGYSDIYPQQVHHRGHQSRDPADANTGCNGFKWLESTDPNPNVAMGALVGGPFKNDSYIDLQNNSMQAEPTTYNSAVLVGLLSGLVTTSSIARSLS